MAVTVEIASTEVAHLGNVQVDLQAGAVPAASCEVDAASATTPYSRGDTFVVKRDGTTVFSGKVRQISCHAVTPPETRLRWLVEAEGTAADFGRIYVTATYSDTAAGAVMTDIVDDYLSGVTYTGVNNGPTIETATYQDVTVQEAFDDLAARTGYVWVLDPSSDDMTFKRPDDMTAAPFSITDSPSNKPYRNLRIDKGGNKYYNAVTIFGGDAAGGQIVEAQTVKLADEHVRLNRRVSSITSATRKIEPGSPTSQGVGEKGVADGDTNLLWTFGSATVEITNRTSTTDYTNTAEYLFTYNGLRPLVYVYRDQSEIDSNGLYEAPPIVNNSIRSNEAALEVGKAFIRRHARFEVQTLSFETDTRILAVSGWQLEPGQALSVTNADLNLNDTYIIDSVTVRELPVGHLHYSVTATPGEPQEPWQQTLRRLLGQFGGGHSPDTEDPLHFHPAVQDTFVPTISITLTEV